MFDAPDFLRKMSDCIGDARLGDVKFVAECLGLDLSNASMNGAGKSVLAVHNAELVSCGRGMLVVTSKSPKMLFGLLDPPSPPFTAADFDGLGVAAKRVKSKYSEGVGFELWIGGYQCAVIASNENGIIEGFSCRELPVAQHPAATTT